MANLSTIDFTDLGDEVMAALSKADAVECRITFNKAFQKREITRSEINEVVDILHDLGYPIKWPGILIEDPNDGLISTYFSMREGFIEFDLSMGIRTVSPPNKSSVKYEPRSRHA